MDGINQQHTHNNHLVSIKESTLTFGSSQQAMQAQLNEMSLLSTQSCVWNSFITTNQNLHLDITPSTSSNLCRPINKNILPILSHTQGHVGNRNILISNIPSEYSDIIDKVIKVYYKDFIYDTFAKHCLGTVTIVALFYGMDQAKICYDQLSYLMENEMELNLVDLSFCSSATVSSTFAVEMEKLQDTHLLVSLSGALSKIDGINYEGILESFGKLHHLAHLERCEIKLALLVEYKDTRHAVKAQNALDNRIDEGIVFNARLTKLDVEQSKARTIQKSLSQLRPLSGSQIKSPSTHTHSPHIVPQHSLSRIFDTRKWLPLLPSPYVQFSRHLSPCQQTSSLQVPPLCGGQQYQLASNRNQSKPFALQTKNDDAIQPSMSLFNFAMDPYNHHLPIHTIPDSGMPSPLNTHQYSINRSRMGSDNTKDSSDDNANLNQRFSSDNTRHQDLNLKTANLPTTANNASGWNMTTENKTPLHFGSITSSSLSTMDCLASTFSSHSLTINSNITWQNMNASLYRPRPQPAIESFAFDLDKVINNLDTRTTFMIRNIPNKYTQAMLIDCIDATHKNTYDFLYLRMDFKTNSNVGYAFINFINYKSVIGFAKRMVGRQWNNFNSEKRCELSYAKVQGKASLIEKFRNSDVMDQEPSYRPIIFYSSGPNKGEKEDFPKGKSVSASRYHHSSSTPF